MYFHLVKKKTSNLATNFYRVLVQWFFILNLKHAKENMSYCHRCKWDGLAYKIRRKVESTYEEKNHKIKRDKFITWVWKNIDSKRKKGD